jgi:hypothetical protein
MRKYIPRLSQPLRTVGYLLVIGMVVLAVWGLINRPEPPVLLNNEQIEATVQAGVIRTLTAQAPTPDIQGTIDARATDVARGTPLPPTASPTPEPSPTPQPSIEQQISSGANNVLGFVGGVFNALWGLVMGLWNFLAFGGVLLQVCCCVGIPALIVIGLVAERSM